MKHTQTYYFAYGSNMDKEQMAYRCPNADFVGIGEVKAYRFAIDAAGVATIIPAQSTSVEGAVWLLTDSDIANLDIYEGVKQRCYRKEYINVELANGESIKALVYISNRKEIGQGIGTASGYMNRIVTAAKDIGLTDMHIRLLEDYACNRYYKRE